jgi:DNA uptake protein ComE-like DNA-binding protein
MIRGRRPIGFENFPRRYYPDRVLGYLSAPHRGAPLFQTTWSIETLPASFCKDLVLAADAGKAENGVVRVRMQFSILAVALLGAFMAGTAQYGDRDTRGTPKTSATAPSPEKRLDINHATVDELLKVPSMTRSWAGRIVRFRPYRTKQDLLEKGVVSSEVYDHIKDYVIAHQKAQ